MSLEATIVDENNNKYDIIVRLGIVEVPVTVYAPNAETALSRAKTQVIADLS